jgi:Fe2+ transport system protein FeoA
MENTEAESWISLHDVEPGQRVRVQKLSGQPALCHRLREMGFCEAAEVKILTKGGAMLCQVCNSKVCLSRQLAESILVDTAVV